MEAIKFERPFHSHLSFSVMCWSQGDYSLGRDVPYSPGPEGCLCLSVWHLLWWVICLLLLHQRRKPTVLVGDGENTTGCPACDIWESPGCRLCGFRVRSIQKANAEQYKVHSQVLPICWPAGMWDQPRQPLHSTARLSQDRGHFHWDGMWWWGSFLGARMRPESSSHDGKNKSTLLQFVVYEYWCIRIRVQDSEQAPGEFTSKSTHFAKVAIPSFCSETPKLLCSQWENKAQLSFMQKWVSSLPWERLGAG